MKIEKKNTCTERVYCTDRKESKLLGFVNNTKTHFSKSLQINNLFYNNQSNVQRKICPLHEDIYYV